MWLIGTVYANYPIGKSVTNMVKPKAVCRITSPPIPPSCWDAVEMATSQQKESSTDFLPLPYFFKKLSFGKFLPEISCNMDREKPLFSFKMEVSPDDNETKEVLC